MRNKVFYTLYLLIRQNYSDIILVIDVEVKSVKKKFKSKGFAAGVDRDVILKGCNMIHMELDKVIKNTILGMRDLAKEIGLEF